MDSLETTTIGAHQDVILTTGVLTANGKRLYGVFHTAADARSSEADRLCLAIIGGDSLTDEQRKLAERNSQAL